MDYKYSVHTYISHFNYKYDIMFKWWWNAIDIYTFMQLLLNCFYLPSIHSLSDFIPFYGPPQFPTFGISSLHIFFLFGLFMGSTVMHCSVFWSAVFASTHTHHNAHRKHTHQNCVNFNIYIYFFFICCCCCCNHTACTFRYIRYAMTICEKI